VEHVADVRVIFADTDGSGKVVRAPAEFAGNMRPENTTSEKGG